MLIIKISWKSKSIFFLDVNKNQSIKINVFLSILFTFYSLFYCSYVKDLCKCMRLSFDPLLLLSTIDKEEEKKERKKIRPKKPEDSFFTSKWKV